MIRFEEVTFRYTAETPRIVENINLEMRSGRITVILGPNGCGKTTLLHLILGWHHPNSGAITINRRTVADYTARERGRLMSLVPQSEYIPFEYSLIEYALLGRLPYMNPLEIPGSTHVELAKQAINMVGLDPEDTRPVTVLSGGEKQLLLLARALCQQPDVLILDEPTSHLDLANKKKLSDILQGLGKEGLTVVCTTHEPDFALAVGEDLILLSGSGIVAQGRMEDAFTDENLSKTYSSPIRTEKMGSRKAVFWW